MEEHASQGSYTPQFPLSWSSIVSRVNAPPPRSSPPRDDSKLLETLPLPVSASGDPALTYAQSLERECPSANVDFTQDTIPFPLPRAQCVKCLSTSEAAHNALLSCAECAVSWHQQCVTPPIADDAVHSSVFLCKRCEDPSIRYPAGPASEQALTEYFSKKPKADLLNILSSCSHLRPTLLIDILVSVARKNPDLPMFDSPEWSKPPAPGRIKKPRRHKKIIKLITSAASVLADADDEEERDSLPPTWPKAGEGLYARIKAEDEDRALLLDENDEEAFSHFAVDKNGRQIPLSACG